jgi:hypothetical protein
MWGVFFTTGLLLGSFRDFDAAALACRAWPQAVRVVYLGSTRVDR